MARIAHPICLSSEEQELLRSMFRSGSYTNRELLRARALLLMDEGKSQEQVCNELGIDRNRYYKIKSRYLSGGLPAALGELPRSGTPAKVTERVEAHITALACSQAPDGRSRWTISMLGDKLVELEYVDSISRESVRKVLKKASSNPGPSRCGA